MPLVIGLVVACAAAVLSAPLPAEAVDEPSTAPDGPGLVAYQTADVTRTEDGRSATANGISVVGLDGTGPREITSPTYPDRDHTPTWSPDGRWLTYTHDGDSQSGVYVLGRDSDTPTYFPSLGTPTWSPDGRFVAFAGGSAMLIAPVESLAPELVIGEPTVVPTAHSPGQLSFSPDGTGLVFTLPTDNTYYRGQLYWIAPDGTGLRPLLEGIAVTRGRGAIDWAPDGSTVGAVGLVEGSAPADSHTVLYLVSPDGTAQRIVRGDDCPASPVDQFAWSPAGDVLAVTQRCGSNGIQLLSLDGTLLGSLGADRYSYQTIFFSPDATSVIAAAEDRDATWETAGVDLYRLPVDGSKPQRLTTAGDVFADTAQAVDPGAVARLFGATPAQTAAAVSRSSHGTADTAVLATLDQAMWGLGAAPLAGADAPLLLSSPTAVAPATLDELRRLGVSSVTLAGPFSAAAVEQLHDIGIATTPLEGANPYWAAAAVAERIGSPRAYLVAGYETRTGIAVAAAGAAARREVPMLFTRSSSLPAATRHAIAAGNITDVTVVGDRTVIHESVMRELEHLGVLDVRRLSAATPYEASSLLAQRAWSHGVSVAEPVVATGSSWRHAVAAAPAAAASNTVLILVAPKMLRAGPASAAWLAEHRADIRRARLVGGPIVVSPRTEVGVERRVN